MRVLDLGRVDYVTGWRVMKAVHREVAAGGEDALILAEHDHVITVGKHGRVNNVVRWELPVYVVERGGDATYHGPGQLVAYPVVRLRWDLARYIWMLEEAVIKSVEPLGVVAGRRDRHRGVWVGGKKLASVGIAVENGVAYHGVAVNVSTDLAYFAHINPCGLPPHSMTSLRELGLAVTLEEYKRHFLKAFSEVFSAELHPEDPGPYLQAASRWGGSPPRAYARQTAP